MTLPGADVPRGDHLAREEFQLVAGHEHGHAEVVGQEGAAQVQPEQQLVHCGEEEAAADAEDDDQASEVQGVVHREQAELGKRVAQ